jgi:hypothetical protein
MLPSNGRPIVARVCFRGNVFTESLPSNGSIHHNSRNRSVGIATAYVLDGRGSNPGGGMIFLFSTACPPAVRPTQPPTQWVPGDLFPGLKRLGREVYHSRPSSV